MGSCSSSPAAEPTTYSVKQSPEPGQKTRRKSWDYQSSPNSEKKPSPKTNNTTNGAHKRVSSSSEQRDREREKEREREREREKERERERERSRSKSRSKQDHDPTSQSKNGKNSSSKTTAGKPTSGKSNSDNKSPSSNNNSNYNNSNNDWKLAAAAAVAASASELQAEDRELDDWQRGMVDIFEEQSIQAYDMDVSVGPGGLERRYSGSFLGTPSQQFEMSPSIRATSIGARSSLRQQLLMKDLATLSSSENQQPHQSTVLVVDQHPSTRQIISKWLASRKIVEISCATGAQAVEALNARANLPPHLSPIDAIVADVNVFVNDDLLLLDWVINQPQHISTIPVIVLTSNLPSQGLERLIRRGAWDVMHKPLNRAVFLNALSSIFSSRKQKNFIEKLKLKGDEYKERLMAQTSMSSSLKSRSLNGGKLNPLLSTAVPTRSSIKPGIDIASLLTPAQPSRSLAAPGADGTASSSSSPSQISIAAASQPIQILLVEHDTEVVAKLRSWIESASVTVKHVKSITEAIACLRESQKAAVLAATSFNSPQVQVNEKPIALNSGNNSTATTNPNSNPTSRTNTNASGISLQLAAGSVSPSPALNIRNLATESAAGALVRTPSVGSNNRSIFVPMSTTPMQFGVELILVGHDMLVPPGSEDLAALALSEEDLHPTEFEDEEDELSTEPHSNEGSFDSLKANKSASPGQQKQMDAAKARILSSSLAESQVLVDLSLHPATPIVGKKHRLPLVVLCDEDGPSPVAMAILKHVALTVVNAPYSQQLVNKKMSIILASIQQNRQSLLLARRANMYRHILNSTAGFVGGGSSSLGGSGGGDSSAISSPVVGAMNSHRSLGGDESQPHSPGARTHDARNRLLNFERSERARTGSPTMNKTKMFPSAYSFESNNPPAIGGNSNPGSTMHSPSGSLHDEALLTQALAAAAAASAGQDASFQPDVRNSLGKSLSPAESAVTSPTNGPAMAPRGVSPNLSIGVNQPPNPSYPVAHDSPPRKSPLSPINQDYDPPTPTIRTIQKPSSRARTPVNMDRSDSPVSTPTNKRTALRIRTELP